MSEHRHHGGEVGVGSPEVLAGEGVPTTEFWAASLPVLSLGPHPVDGWHGDLLSGLLWEGETVTKTPVMGVGVGHSGRPGSSFPSVTGPLASWAGGG